MTSRYSRAVSGRPFDGAPPWRWGGLRPRGPRSGASDAVSHRHHLIDPIRPTRRHIAISLHGSLYAMPSLCGSAEATRGWFRAFAVHSFLTCHPLGPRGARSSFGPERRCRHGLRRDLSSSALPILPQSVSRGARLSGLLGSHICYGLSGCSPSCTDQTDMLGLRGLLLPGFQRVGRPPRCWI